MFLGKLLSWMGSGRTEPAPFYWDISNFHQERFPQSHLSYLHWSISTVIEPIALEVLSNIFPIRTLELLSTLNSKAPHLNYPGNRRFHCIARTYQDRIRWHRGKYGLYRNSGTHQIHPGLEGWSHTAIDKQYSLQCTNLRTCRSKVNWEQHTNEGSW